MGDSNKSPQTKEKTNMMIGIAVIVIILLALAYYYYVNYYANENFTPVYLDEMAMKYSDPMFFKYSSWERDVDGMSPRDYYLENQMNYGNQIAPGYFKGDRLFTDKTDYLNMPPQYRPKRPVQKSGELKITKQELDTRPINATALHLDRNLSGKVGPYSGSMDRDVNMAYTWETCC